MSLTRLDVLCVTAKGYSKSIFISSAISSDGPSTSQLADVGLSLQSFTSSGLCLWFYYHSTLYDSKDILIPGILISRKLLYWISFSFLSGKIALPLATSHGQLQWGCSAKFSFTRALFLIAGVYSSRLNSAKQNLNSVLLHHLNTNKYF